MTYLPKSNGSEEETTEQAEELEVGKYIFFFLRNLANIGLQLLRVVTKYF